MAIIDVELPGLDGYQVARDIRNQSPSLPVLIISANSGDSWRQQAFDAGADEFLAKPVRPSELIALLQRYCSLPTSG